MSRIEIADRQAAVAIPSSRVRSLARRILSAEGRRGRSLSVAFVGNAEIRRINRRFLKHDFATDVISFPLEDGADDLLGELVISTEYAAGEAGRRGIAVEEEVLRYVAHGLLHLLGYDDTTPSKKRVMWARQEGYLPRGGASRRRRGIGRGR